MSTALWIVGILAGLLGLHLLLDWMEQRGWIYYRRGHGWAGRAGSAMLELQQMVEPGKKHVLEMKRDEKRKEEKPGEPPLEG